MWPNSWQIVLMLYIRCPPSGQMKYDQRFPWWVKLARCGQYRSPRLVFTLAPAYMKKMPSYSLSASLPSRVQTFSTASVSSADLLLVLELEYSARFLLTSTQSNTFPSTRRDLYDCSM